MLLNPMWNSVVYHRFRAAIFCAINNCPVTFTLFYILLMENKLFFLNFNITLINILSHSKSRASSQNGGRVFYHTKQITFCSVDETLVPINKLTLTYLVLLFFLP